MNKIKKIIKKLFFYNFKRFLYMINNLILKLIFFKILKNNEKKTSINKNITYLEKFGLINYNSIIVNYSGIINLKTKKNYFLFFNNVFFSFRFFLYNYIYNFFFKTFIIKKLIPYSFIYKNLLFKKIYTQNLLIFNLFFKKKLLFFKNFNKNYLLKKRKKYKNFFTSKIIKIRKKSLKKINFNFKNLNTFFINSNYRKKRKNLLKIKFIKNGSIFYKNIDFIFFNNKLTFNDKVNDYKNIDFKKYQLFTTKNSFTLLNTFWRRHKKKKNRKRRFYEYNKKKLNIKNLFILSNKKKIKKKKKFNLYKLFNFTNIIKKKVLNFKFFNEFIMISFFLNLKILNYKILYKFRKKKIKKINAKKNNKYYHKQFQKFFKKKPTRIGYNLFKSACKNIIFIDNFYNNKMFNNKKYDKEALKLIYNTFSSNSLKILNNFKFFKFRKLNNFFIYNNYYPVVYCNGITSRKFFSKFKLSFNINYLTYVQFYILSFLENFFKKKIFLKITNNFFRKTKNLNFLNSIFLSNRNYQPRYMKGYYISDFIEILWYSFYLKDLTLINDWLCKFFESTHFRFHRKFILFLQNFFNKYSFVFINVLQIKGFFFDIRGKVGVSGNSKKRHYFFKFGEINRSTKSSKINFSQSVIRTPSGAMGLTLIINY